tara:strand:+ start:17 stop:292 length:276 start_codon:yes stop_codon:yes gene_type:complete
VHALEQWLHFAKIGFGPIFVGTSRDGKRTLETRLNDKHVARLIKRTVPASSAELDERYVQKQLGHASAEMTRRYSRRRDRFRENITKVAGL